MNMKKMLCSMLCFALFLTSASAAFATDGVVPPIKENERVGLIEKVDEDISMIQPKEIKAGKGAIAAGNSIISGRNTDVDISILPLQKRKLEYPLLEIKRW